jgi:hypothetical protein
MPQSKLRVGACIIAITGLAHNRPVWSRKGPKIHIGPTIGMRVTLPHDEPRVFNIPYPLGREALQRHVSPHGPILDNAQLKKLHQLIDVFAEYVSSNHGSLKPYHHEPEGSADCTLVLTPVVARVSVGKADAMETVTRWF